MLQAEFQLQVAPFLTFTHPVVGAVALLLHGLQLLAHWAAVHAFVTGVPAVCIRVVRARDTQCLPSHCTVLFEVGARGTFVTQDLTTGFWVVMKVLWRRGFLGGPFNDVQELEGAQWLFRVEIGWYFCAKATSETKVTHYLTLMPFQEEPTQRRFQSHSLVYGTAKRIGRNRQTK